MSFIKSAINQVGRDAGKVVSNQIFGDAHSTPIRSVDSAKSKRSVDSAKSKKIISEFEKSLNFQMSFKPGTLINKLLAVQITFKNEMKDFLSDDYLSMDESDDLFNMIGQFNSKISDMDDVLRIDEEKNKNEIEQLSKIAEQVVIMFCETLDVAIKGCNANAIKNLDNAKNEKKPVIFGRKEYKETVDRYNLIAEMEYKRAKVYFSVRESNLKNLEDLKK